MILHEIQQRSVARFVVSCPLAAGTVVQAQASEWARDRNRRSFGIVARANPAQQTWYDHVCVARQSLCVVSESIDSITDIAFHQSTTLTAKLDHSACVRHYVQRGEQLI